MIRHITLNLIIAATLFVSTGCLLTSSKSVQESGTAVSPATLRQVEVGSTTEDWLVAALGKPTSRQPVRGPGHVEIIGYNHEIVKKSKGSVFLLFKGSSHDVDRNTTYFEISQGVVTKYWTES